MSEKDGYICVSASSSDELTEKVCNAMKAGFRPIGAVSLSVSANGQMKSERLFAQGMIYLPEVRYE